MHVYFLFLVYLRSFDLNDFGVRWDDYVIFVCLSYRDSDSVYIEAIDSGDFV